MNALETIQCAATWPNAKVSSIHPEVHPRCCFCGELDDDLHAYWTCPRHEQSVEEDITNSQSLIQLAITEAATWPVFWFRGIVPSEAVSLPPDYVYHNHQSISITGHGNFTVPEGSDTWPTGIYFGDASGGPYTDIPTIRRIGYGLAAYSEEQGSLLFTAHFPLLGEVQTVPRGETMVIHAIASMLAPNSSAVVYTDNLLVYNTFARGEEYAKTSLNADLWALIFKYIKGKSLSLAVLWFPSHLDDPEKAERIKDKIPEWVTPWHIQGNAQADRLAESAAKFATIPPDIASPILMRLRQIRLVQRRLSHIICNLPSRTKTTKEKSIKNPALSIEGLAEQSQHLVCFGSTRVVCTKCHQSHSLSSETRAKKWLQTTCQAPTDDSYPPNTKITIGNRTTHPSHRLAVKHGLVYCRYCGCYSAGTHISKLADPCRPRTMHGEKALAALARGFPPPNVQWPLPPSSLLRLSGGLTAVEQSTLLSIVLETDRMAAAASSSGDILADSPIAAAAAVRHSLDDPEADMWVSDSD